MDTDVRSTNVTATGSVRAAPTRVRKIVFVSTETAGSVVLRDGGSGGSVEIDIDTPAVAGLHAVDIPCNGVRFSTDVHATLSNVSSLTVFYG